VLLLLFLLDLDKAANVTIKSGAGLNIIFGGKVVFTTR